MTNITRALKIIYLFFKYDIDKSLMRSNIIGFKKYLFLLLPWNLLTFNKSINLAQNIRLICEDLGPIFVKLGQTISTRKDLLSDEIANELVKLQDNVTPFDGNTAKKIIEKELGKSTEDIFSFFETKPMASASIAQVHPAKLKTGEEVIVKVVRPDIKEKIIQDISLMKKIASYLDGLSSDFKRMHLIDIVNDYEMVIYDELNLIKEAASAKQIKKNFSGASFIYIPTVHCTYLTSRVMVMERIYGIPINNKERLAKEGVSFKEIAEKSVELFFVQVFEHNFFHADMHPGNIFIQKHNDTFRFVLVDFGIMGSLSEFDKKYLAENFIAFFNRDYARVAKLHVECEWVPKDTNMPSLESAIRENCECMLDKPIKDVSLSDIIINLFDTARRFKLEVQPQLILMQKTLLYTEGLGREFNPELDLWKTSRPILEKWMKDQKGPKVIAKKVFNNLDSYMEILPEIPSFFRRISNHYSGNSSDLTKNFDQLKIIEQKLHANKIRNHYYFSIILLVGIFVAPLGALDIYKNEVLILLVSLMYFTKPK
ncbi:MAG: 2-polyprenylphenol 6-hydroxylase [Gammaproteobacteria bacterium]